jgi:hypothetical protein
MTGAAEKRFLAASALSRGAVEMEAVTGVA